VHDYATKLCRRQTEIILNHENPNVPAIWQGGARRKEQKRLTFGGGQIFDHSSA
jgi:hypothetical protein